MTEKTNIGLEVILLPRGWAVIHAASGKPAVSGLRLRRFAEEALRDLLATGMDFTQDSATVQRKRCYWAEAYYLWKRRSEAKDLDPETFEYYPKHSRYGQMIPSAAMAARLRKEAER